MNPDLTPERHEQFGELYHAALAQPTTERAAFLAQACGADDQLRGEVEALLALDAQAAQFIEAPALEVAAEMLAAEHARLSAGAQVGPYRILNWLGAGGMGEVYLAEDTRLGRKVALKLLPSSFTQDSGRLRRFEQEARAASALNHPNIITIYEVGQVGAHHYIATEFVEGQTLRARLKSARLSLLDALEVAWQTAAALTAAHAAGIIHRDIKPENIMVRPDGLVKVLDFGLAKLSERQSTAATPSSLSAPGLTTPGTVLGTAHYMSPEQARGVEVDARTDLFSLGVVLYEMVSGQRPFEGATTTDVLAAILHVTPPALNQFAAAVPPELEQLVSQALAKEREQRYQTAGDLLHELKLLKQAREFAAHTPKPRSASSLKALRRTLKQSQRTALIVGVALLVITLSVAGGLSLLKRFNQARSSKELTMRRLTTTGKAGGAALSPDGKLVAYIVTEEGQRSLWLKQTATLSTRLIIPPSRTEYTGLTFAPDGDYLYYLNSQPGDAHYTLYRIPMLGGPEQRLMTGVDYKISFAPDGRHIAFIRGNSDIATELVIANLDGTNEQVLARRQSPAAFWSVSWSPAGQKLACSEQNKDAQGFYANVVEVDLLSKAEKVITTRRWRFIGEVAWLAGGSGLVMLANDKSNADLQLWQLGYPGGEERLLQNDLSSYANLSLSADTKMLVTTRNAQDIQLWAVPANDPAQAKQITTGSEQHDGLNGVAWTPDGRIVYASGAGGAQDLWICEADGSQPKQLTVNSGLSGFGLWVSPDGRYIVFVASRNSPPHIYRVNLDGSNLTSLTSGTGEFNPFCAPDGKWVYFRAPVNGRRTLWRVPLAGGPAEPLLKLPSDVADISPDGKWFAYFETFPDKKRLGIIPVEGGTPVKQFDLGVGATRFRWSPDGLDIAYADTRQGAANLWIQSLSGGPPRQLTTFKTGFIPVIAWSPDGKQLLCARTSLLSDIVMISDFW